MTKTEFVKQLTTFFVGKGFSCRYNHFYKEMTSDVIIVFGMHTSSYGGYCYLEYGYCFKSINKYLPYPKFNQLNLNCGRLMTGIGKAMVYEQLNENIVHNIEKTIGEEIDNLIDLVNLGKDRMIKFYLYETTNKSWFILGEETADYFGLPREAFKYHIVLPN